MDEKEAVALLDAEELRVRALMGQLETGGMVGHSGTTEHLMPPEDRFPDDGAELAERTLELGLVHRFDADLQAINDARARVKSGRFGTCSRCGAAIADERLRAMPTAERCILHA